MLTVLYLCSVGLSPQLIDLLSRMMHPDPRLRPTADDILSERCVMLHNYQQSCYRACYWTLSRCRLAVSSLWALVVFLYGLFPGKGGKGTQIAENDLSMLLVCVL